MPKSSILPALLAQSITPAAVFELQAETENLQLGNDSNADLGIWTVIDRHKSALGGVGVIIATQIAKRIVVELGETIADRVAGDLVVRVLGKAGTTLIPVAGWVVGAGLIVYDLYQSRDGAIPQIQERLKSSEVKSAITAPRITNQAADLSR